ncbi:ion channel [Salinimicrobium gaetbulicola]|uniref:Ion channel n=1 Tax=Salinimicrobium gaetbulicola TaxID=999702 RepID=A0ABW3IDL7_9FLAO
MEVFQIIIGILIILITFLDFFHTTFSGRGFGFLSGALNRLLNNMILQNRSRSIFNFSGLTHLLITSFVWMALLYWGTFIIFTAGDEMVINSTTHLPATTVQRFYFTCYLLSTLGIGDFIPGNQTSQVLAGILSFTGFVLITTGLTYLLSVVQAVLGKKELSFLLSTMGCDVEQIYKFYKQEDDLSGFVSDAENLRQLILKNASSYLAFPMVNYFLSKERDSALIVQLAALHEVLEVLKMDWAPNTIEHTKINVVINAIEQYLKLGLESPEDAPDKLDSLTTLRSFWRKYGYVYKRYSDMDRRLTASLRYAGWNWKEVYRLKEQQ